MHVQSYLTFNGRCEEAIEFYKKALGAKVEMMMRFKDAPGDHKCSPGTENNIMHSCLRIGDTAVMASDGMAQGKPEFKGFSLALNYRLVFLAPLGLAALAALGADRLVQRRSRTGELAIAAAGSLLLLRPVQGGALAW